MIKLAAVIITFNEEVNIARCLESLQGIADEIVVVDSYSTDQTEHICNQYPVKFIRYEWQGYTHTKNYANSLVESDYILSIDADEALSEQLKESLLTLKQAPVDDTVWVVSRLTNYCGTWIKHCGWYPDKKTRLWKKDQAHWEGEIHERLITKGTLNHKLLNGNLLHYSFHSIEQHISTINKYSTIAAQEKLKKGKSTNLLRILVKPTAKFVIAYFFKLGFLDGFYGFIVCRNSAYSSFLKEVKLKQIKD